jgi:carbamate kinase
MGNILIRVEEGDRRVPHLPVDTCVADAQGGMGYMIQRLAVELFQREGIDRPVATVITQVLVRPDDPEFAQPSKPIGQYYTAEQAGQLRLERSDWDIRPVDRGMYRRVVPSPHPLRVLESQPIALMLHAGVVVIACGGGGIPVAWDGDKLIGVEGVVDKDLASALLASAVGATRLVIVTSVDRVALHYGKPEQQWLASISIEQARRYLAAGEFPPGSMGPKVEAAIGFLERGGETCVITSAERLADAMMGREGTHIVRGSGK